MDSSGFCTRAGLANSRWYGGALLSLLATGGDTDGALSVVEGIARAGEEVPFHTHANEDEAFYVLDGEMTCHVGDRTFRAGPGDFVWLPRRVRHSWRAESDRLRFLVFVTPAGFEQTFVEFSEPAATLDLPPADAGPPPEAFERLLERERDLGIVYEPA